MQEALLHFIWKLQYFNHTLLKTTCGQRLEIISRGTHNLHAGPDFSYAQVKINDITWAGNIEIHVKTSDWAAHKHHKNKAYDNVILHVVWDDNSSKVTTSQGNEPPILCLKNRVSSKVVENYSNLLKATKAIPCSNMLKHVPEIYIKFMMEKALSERLERKANLVNNFLKENKNDWEQTVYLLFMEAMGFKTNADAFKTLARILPHRILIKQESLLQVEALLFGKAGFLESNSISDSYYNRLKKEYLYLSAKYQLSPGLLSEKHWHFMRLRPVNFPTLRLAQVAAVIFYKKRLMEVFISPDLTGNKKLFGDIKQAVYWQENYHFGKRYPSKLPFIGSASQNSLLINVSAPLMVARTSYLGDDNLFEQAMELLSQLKGENNAIVRKWEPLGLMTNNAYDTQAIIEMNNTYCKNKKCLDCRIGNYLISNKVGETVLD